MKFIKILLVLIVWSLAVRVVCSVNSIYSADKFSVQATEFLKEREPERALILINKSIEINPLEPSYYRTRALVYLTAGILEENGENLSDYKSHAYVDLQKSLEVNRDSLVTERNVVPVYYFLANGNPFSVPGAENHDAKFIGETEEFYQMLKSRYSQDAGVISLVAEYERKLGLTEEYEKSKEMIRVLRPDLLDWYSSFN
ncbi:hypothetical protein A2380_02970 [candidate division WWE3 bacterium RIFOXYB1_FULL_43_24]|uniref:Tetratricopeptide repeat protein n=1 Tax=candidate division WWE3 bacterium GW2011_GWF1_42_14 TaxID=1619138 RepID=A0A0G0YLP4_UNCKA|nr:MAG: hypothetical protein UU92_C0007G0022 [candidate division WWE3 bacterium GW2011_GWA1_42_12]KKS37585.1 MAG: hypothetical protein UV00_C0013G0016 [candidate division WWE3 bacterium GW2011_GWF1_42_14]OGC58719.1 MAG: hypothetical protein A2212_00545 [candidate division WWE3 bacterium RIFOXYA1_FULL_42_9]OGC69058.1 MAG: hypothetical protein A2380_02970 [candidate division WWE3 bacterium RIFOXYB1_FULL_43_24]OGC72234.1 MAG: hypothetical protein A2414_01605 [candidate division WWE3 bacterium RIFO